MFRPQTESSRNMTHIQCQDSVFLTTDFDACVKELSADSANFQTPLHITIPPGKRCSVPLIRAHELVVEFDGTRTTRAAVASILAKYDCRERSQGWDASSGGPAPSKPAPDFVSVITTQTT